MRKHAPKTISCILFLAFILIQSYSYAQGKAAVKSGSIKGSLIDAETKNAVAYASVALLQSDKTLLNAIVSDPNGGFSFQQVLEGRYLLSIKFLGYKPLLLDSISIGPGHWNVNKGNIRLKPDTQMVKVVLNGEKSLFEDGFDKKVFNVDKSLVSQGGSATDVLQTVPAVSVDVDGNVALRGNANVTVLIDGKPSGLTGADRAAILAQIPANAIDKIEIITNPSAKYDADGTAGILNIILKKNKKAGSNLVLSGGIGDRNKYNGGLDYNYRTARLNVYASYSVRYNPRWAHDIINRKNTFKDTTFSINQITDFDKRNIGHLARAGMDYDLNKRNNIGFTLLYNFNNNPESKVLEYNRVNENNMFTGLTRRSNFENENGGNLDAGFNYRLHFAKPKEEFTASALYSNSQYRSLVYSSQYDYNAERLVTTAPEVLQNTWSDVYYKVTTLQADYVNPINEHTRLDMGYKSIIRDNDNNFRSESYYPSLGHFTNDSNISNHFIYHEQIHGVYGIVNYTKGLYGLQAGLRAEQALTGSTLVNTHKDYSNNYFNLFPSVHMQRNFGERNTLNLSYSRKINRPSPRALNPFTDYTDPLNLRFGNPYLKPEYINFLELAHKYNYKKFLLSSSIYYRRTTNVIQQLKTLASTGVATNTNVNLNSSDEYGFEMITRMELYKWWNLTGNIELYHTKLNGANLNTDLSNSGFSGFAKMSSGFTIMKGLQTQISANYQAPMVIAQGRIRASYSADWGMKKEIMKGKGSIGASLSDIFNTRQFVFDINDPSYIYYSVRKRESRVFTINFSYRIGQNSDNPGPSKRMERQEEGGAEE